VPEISDTESIMDERIGRLMPGERDQWWELDEAAAVQQALD
jgi:hypothetical protein